MARSENGGAPGGVQGPILDSLAGLKAQVLADLNHGMHSLERLRLVVETTTSETILENAIQNLKTILSTLETIRLDDAWRSGTND
jgi:hypothetical protein